MNKIAILGGGIAGLTTAIALQQKGYDPIIFEASNSIRTVGAGIVIATNAMKALSLLGLDKEVESKGRSIGSFMICDKKGSPLTINDEELFSKSYGFKSYGILRSDFHQILQNHISSDRIFLGKKSQSIKYENNKVLINFNDGSNHICDHVIVAEGIHSPIRQQLLPHSKPRYSGYTCWRGMLYDTELKGENGFEAWGEGRRFGYLPLEGNKIYWFACVNSPYNSSDAKNKSTRELSALFHDFLDPVPELIKNTTDNNVIWSDIIDIKPIPQYAFHSNILLIGDAGHATTPNMGQGACQAIEDAYILAEEIGKYGTFSQAIKQFEKRRLNRTHFITNQSKMIGDMGQLENPLLCKMRNMLIRNTPSFITNRQVGKVFTTDF